MRLIDADALKEGIKELKQSPWYNNDINPSWRQGIKDAVHVVEILCIDEAPTVEAVPVVRCKDCKYYEFGQNETDAWSSCYAHVGRIIETWDDNFCGWADRKEE